MKTKAVDRAYFNLYFHFTNGEELKKMSTRTRNALIKKLENQIAAYETMPKNWNFGQGAEYHEEAKTVLRPMLEIAKGI